MRKRRFKLERRVFQKFLYDFHLLSDSDNQSSIWIVFKIEFVHEVGHELEESTSSFSEVSFESDGCFGFLELFHLATGLGVYSSPGITDFHIDSENTFCCFEVYGEVVFIERKTSILDGIVHELIRDENEAILPWYFDVILLEEKEDEITDDLGLVIVCLENQLQVKTPKIGNVFIDEIDEFTVFQVGDIYL